MSAGEDLSLNQREKDASIQPGGLCSTPPASDWSEPEKWIWQQICEGNIADFNQRYGELDPKTSDGWSETREITPSFLETILTRKPYESVLHRQGVRICGAFIRQPVDLENASLNHQWWLEKSRFEADINLSQLKSTNSISFDKSAFLGNFVFALGRVGGQLSMDGAQFQNINLRVTNIKNHLSMIGATCAGTLDMDALEVDGSLFMREGGQFKHVILQAAKVKGHLDMVGATCTGKLDMNSLEVDGSLFMREGAQLRDVNLTGTKVKGQFDMTGATCTGNLNMDALEVGSSLFMGGGAKFNDVVLQAAKVKGQLSMVGATCTGNLNMDSLEVGSHLLMREEAKFKQKVSLIFANIGGNLSINGAEFNSLDLTETRIRGELYLGSEEDAKPAWQAGSQLILRNAVLNTIQTPPDLNAWPDKLDLYGCTYTHLGGMTTQSEGRGIAGLKPEQFAELLAKDKSYSPQPYQQLAAILRSMGHPEKADTILYKGKERERTEKWNRKHISKWLGFSLLKWTIGYGYGYRYFRSLLWAFVFTILGALVVSSSIISKDWHPVKMLGFSFDLLLPIVKLDESHSKIFSTITGWQYYYFYIHKLVGYILALFVGAGLSGITKK